MPRHHPHNVPAQLTCHSFTMWRPLLMTFCGHNYDKNECHKISDEIGIVIIFMTKKIIFVTILNSDNWLVTTYFLSSNRHKC